MQLKADDDWADRYLWSGDMTAPDGEPGVPARNDSVSESLAGQITAFLREQAERGQN